MVFFQNSLMYSLTFIFPICCQNPDDLFPVYRLCQMCIHSRLFCLFLIFYKCHWPVIAMIGMSFPLPSGSSRIFFDASRPSMTGIIISIRIRSISCSPDCSKIFNASAHFLQLSPVLLLLPEDTWQFPYSAHCLLQAIRAYLPHWTSPTLTVHLHFQNPCQLQMEELI